MNIILWLQILEIGGLHSDDNNTETGHNAERGRGDLRRLAVVQTPVKSLR